VKIIRIIITVFILGPIICSISPTIAQTDSVKKNIDPHQEYWDRVAKIPYPKLNKKELIQLIERYIVNPFKKETESVEGENFRCKYHNLDKKRKLKLNKANNIILGTLDLIKENGETLTFEFKILINVFLVYGDHYEWKVSRILAKKNKEEEEEWIRLHDFVQQL
jgi:hypothetical protein